MWVCYMSFCWVLGQSFQSGNSCSPVLRNFSDVFPLPKNEKRNLSWFRAEYSPVLALLFSGVIFAYFLLVCLLPFLENTFKTFYDGKFPAYTKAKSSIKNLLHPHLALSISSMWLILFHLYLYPDLQSRHYIIVSINTSLFISRDKAFLKKT